MTIRLLLLIIFSLCVQCGALSTTYTHTLCDESAQVKLIDVTLATLNIFNVDDNNSATTAANISDSQLRIHHNTEEYTYGDHTSNSSDTVDIGYQPSPIILTFTQDSEAINLELTLEDSIDEDQFVSFVSFADGEGGEIITPTENGYSMVTYGDNTLTLDIVYNTSGDVSGRLQGTVEYTEEDDTLTYSTVTCTGTHVGLSETTTFDCDNGETYTTDDVDTGSLTCSPDSTPSLTYDIDVTVNQQGDTFDNT